MLQIITQYQRPAIAFSGGVDSTFLLRAVMDAKGRADAYTLVTPFLPERELIQARSLAQEMGALLYEVDVDVLHDPAISGNAPDRCYHCKKRLFTELRALSKARGCDVLFDGSNIDDQDDYRPGRRALLELEIVSPLQIAALTKRQIRELSRELNLPTADKPAMACLATRFPTDERLTEEGLRRVENAEDAVRDLGFQAVRVRSHGPVARIELPKEQLTRAVSQADKLSAAVLGAGFQFAALDLNGYKMGNMNHMEKEQAHE